MVKQLKRLRKLTSAVGVGLALFGTTTVQGQITQVDYNSLTGTEFVSVNSITATSGAGTNYDGIIVIDGVAFGEHFVGQTVSPSGNFDQIGGTPTGNLSLEPGAPGQNIVGLLSPAGAVLSGVGPAGYPVFDAIGEGAVSILFSSDQSEFGFRLTGGHGGNAYVSFFGDDGSVIDSFTLSALPLVGLFGFARDGGVNDIRGISIWNDDLTGIGLTGFRHDVAAVPEPATWAMLLMGFGAAGYAMRRRRGQNSELLQIA